MPLFEEFSEDIKSKVADITNSTETPYGGANTAAAFLKHFVKDTNWVHIDMAPRMEATNKDNLSTGATGEPIALIAKALGYE